MTHEDIDRQLRDIGQRRHEAEQILVETVDLLVILDREEDSLLAMRIAV